MRNEFGRTIRKQRIRRGFRGNAFATAAGLSESYLSLIERGLCEPPSDEKIKQMADLLGIHKDDLTYMAHRLPEDVRELAEKHPEAVSELVRKNLK